MDEKVTFVLPIHMSKIRGKHDLEIQDLISLFTSFHLFYRIPCEKLPLEHGFHAERAQ